MSVEVLVLEQQYQAIKERERRLSEALRGIPSERVDLPMDKFVGHRSKLQIGDLILAQDATTHTEMGLLVVSGQGWGARCAPLFYTRDGEPILDTNGVNLHDIGTWIEPRIDTVSKAMKPTDAKGRSHLFVPTDTVILRPKRETIQQSVRDYNKYSSWASRLTRLGLILTIPGGSGEILIASGQIPNSGEVSIIAPATTVVGILAVSAGAYCSSKADSSFKNFATNYLGQIANRDQLVKQDLRNAFRMSPPPA